MAMTNNQRFIKYYPKPWIMTRINLMAIERKR
ncbi:hypothetical protein COLO4_15743 [Corchorus olitorius]|uniref:Uncharacterized protein n=1 Tax=Corchorus olitorius TaxID=93759 RepID=A0A1R3JL92_9ROSI|nr:hypothetical protein COLO4_15743 [Corchorus olitorius]